MSLRSDFSFTFDDSNATFHVPLQSYLSLHTEFDSIAIGAVVFSRGPTSKRLLLIQRSAHDTFPLLWEIPGGRCEDGDTTLLHSLARELWEESGLHLKHIGPCLSPKDRHGIVVPVDSEGRGACFTWQGRRVVKYSFLVEVEQPAEVRLDPNEHQRFLWVTEEDCRSGGEGELGIRFTTGQQEATVMEAFRVIGRY